MQFGRPIHRKSGVKNLWKYVIIDWLVVLEDRKFSQSKFFTLFHYDFHTIFVLKKISSFSLSTFWVLLNGRGTKWLNLWQDKSLINSYRKNMTTVQMTNQGKESKRTSLLNFQTEHWKCLIQLQRIIQYIIPLNRFSPD
jgi:hypothetical protein